MLLSIVATETSALTVISVPGIGARGDLTFLQLTFGYLLGRMVVAWCFEVSEMDARACGC